MTKICDNSLVRPLLLVFRKSFDSSYFLVLRKKSNIIPVDKKKKMTKIFLKNYRPISLLLVFIKVFEKMIFNKMYNFLQNEQLLSPNQSS